MHQAPGTHFTCNPQLHGSLVWLRTLLPPISQAGKPQRAEVRDVSEDSASPRRQAAWLAVEGLGRRLCGLLRFPGLQSRLCDVSTRFRAGLDLGSDWTQSRSGRNLLSPQSWFS